MAFDLEGFVGQTADLLADLQWAGGGRGCLMCVGAFGTEHDPDCRLGRLLQAAPEARWAAHRRTVILDGVWTHERLLARLDKSIAAYQKLLELDTNSDLKDRKKEWAEELAAFRAIRDTFTQLLPSE